MKVKTGVKQGCHVDLSNLVREHAEFRKTSYDEIAKIVNESGLVEGIVWDKKKVSDYCVNMLNIRKRIWAKRGVEKDAAAQEKYLLIEQIMKSEMNPAYKVKLIKQVVNEDD